MVDCLKKYLGLKCDTIKLEYPYYDSDYLSTYTAHVSGQRLDIKCFPWKKQQTDVSVCAHTAVWTVVRYFGNKYRNYADTTIGEIVQKVENEWGRKTPSLGLNPVQVSNLLKGYGIINNASDYCEGFIYKKK